MKKTLTLKALNKKLERTNNKYKSDLSDYDKGRYTGFFEALLYIKNNYKLATPSP